MTVGIVTPDLEPGKTATGASARNTNTPPSVSERQDREKVRIAEIARQIRLIRGDSPGLIEIRRPPKVRGEGRTVVNRYPASGVERAARDAFYLCDGRVGNAVYITLNGVDESCEIGTEIYSAASSHNIPRRTRLLIDIDPERAEGHTNDSATEAEKAKARERADLVRRKLDADGWPAPIFDDSGNGYHLTYAIDLPNDDVHEPTKVKRLRQGKNVEEDRIKSTDGPSTVLIKRCLLALAHQFNIPEATSEATSEVRVEAKVDTSVFDAPRLKKLTGTLASKGKHVPGDRPWRWSYNIETPAELVVVTREQLEQLASEAPPEQPKAAKQSAARADRPAVDYQGISASDRVIRASLYAAKIDPAIEGDHGSDRAFYAACKIGPGFDLTPAEAYSVFSQIYNPVCKPPWSPEEIEHKINDAYEEEPNRGWLLTAERDQVAETSPKIQHPFPPDEGEGTAWDFDMGEAAEPNDLDDSGMPDPSGNHPLPGEPGYNPLAEPPDPQIFEKETDPAYFVRVFVQKHFLHPERPLLTSWGDDVYRYMTVKGEPPRYVPYDMVQKHLDACIDDTLTTLARKRAIKAAIQEAMAKSRPGASDPLDPKTAVKKPEKVPFTSKMGSDALRMLKAKVVAPGESSILRWLDDASRRPDPARIIPMRNGLLDIESRKLIPHTPHFFCLHNVGYDFIPKEQAGKPSRWLRFLDEAFPGDTDCHREVQKWMGYLLTPDTKQQKILLLIGKSRSGKGVLLRLLNALVGSANVASPTLASLTESFGLAPLIGKLVATIGDARLSKAAMASLEILLGFSGEDSMQINRKHKDAIQVRPTARFVIASNEPPAYTDPSHAFANRCCPLVFRESFLGREDHGLEAELLRELPQILNWALDGIDYLKDDGVFFIPKSSRAMKAKLVRTNSHITKFVEEAGELLNPDSRRPRLLDRRDEAFGAWREWCRANNYKGDEVGNSENFTTMLTAAFSFVEPRRVHLKNQQNKIPCIRGFKLNQYGRQLLESDRKRQLPPEPRILWAR